MLRRYAMRLFCQADAEMLCRQLREPHTPRAPARQTTLAKQPPCWFALRHIVGLYWYAPVYYYATYLRLPVTRFTVVGISGVRMPTRCY